MINPSINEIKSKIMVAADAWPILTEHGSEVYMYSAEVNFLTKATDEELEIALNKIVSHFFKKSYVTNENKILTFSNNFRNFHFNSNEKDTNIHQLKMTTYKYNNPPKKNIEHEKYSLYCKILTHKKSNGHSVLLKNAIIEFMKKCGYI
ncbi:hypothetical protein HN415_08150 [Candidatus Woesearchaeota archaeon]|jgi:hypothetical protein|nr:hypothetical protein [Candidatus Woesearchaeota archaeon]